MSHDPQLGPRHETVLDVTAEQIARTYAEAFLGAVEADPQRSEWVDELDAVADEVVGPHPEFAHALGSAFLSHEERCEMLQRVLGGRVGEPVLNLLRVMSRHGRGDLIRSVARAVRKQHNYDLGRRRVEIIAAHDLSTEIQEEFRGVVRQRFGFEPVFSVTIDPSLVAGVVLRVGDTVYDGSVSNAFRKAEQAITQQIVQQIERDSSRFVSETQSP